MDYRREESHLKEKKKKHRHDSEERKHKHKKHDRDRERERDQPSRHKKDKKRHRSREQSKDREEHSRSRHHKSYRDRSSSHQKKRKQDERGRERYKEDKYDRWRREKESKYRYDSPPKSDQSEQSEDTQNMEQLNKMKAEKELVSSKADRKLYLGNLPPNITSNQLMNMLNEALKKMQINTQLDGDSITSAWISPDGVGHYAFVEFRTAQEATAGLALNGASLYGYQLKLGRPKQYIEYHKQLLSQFGTDQHIDTILRKVQAMGGYDTATQLKIQQRIVHPPSCVLVLKHIVTIEQLGIDQEYQEILDDISEMAKRHGDVTRIIIPRPLEIDLEEVKKRVKGLGFVFIKYKTVGQAKYARKEFLKQMFSERSVACEFFPEDKFNSGELDVLDKVVIDF